jgi:hypothetical protein
MINSSTPERLAIAFVAMMALLAFGTVNAATLTVNFDTSFGNPLDSDTADPDGPAPWFTAIFDDDGSAGTVTLTMTVPLSINAGDIDKVHFNLDPAMDPADLTITRDSGTGPNVAKTTITIDSDNSLSPTLQADGDGVYDILFDFANGPPSARFSAGEDLVYLISGIPTLTASSFNFLSEPSLDPPGVSDNGPFLAAAFVISTGSGDVFCAGGNTECSNWIAPTPTPIPVPAAAWLFGSSLGLLVWTRRRRTA